MFKKNNSFGMTLIEMMIGLAIGSFVFSSIFEIYLVAENNRNSQKTMIAMQENIQSVSQFLKQAMRATAWSGCAKLSKDFPFKNRLPVYLNEKNKIESYQNKDIKNNSDAIRFWHVDIHGSSLKKTMRAKDVLYVSGNFDVAENDDLIMTDCRTAETMHVKQVYSMPDGTQKIMLTYPLDKKYEENAEVSKLISQKLFVDTTGELDNKNKPVYGLYIENLDGEKIELIDHISQMKIFFSRIENGVSVQHSIHELSDYDEINGILFSLDLNAIPGSDVYKKWNVYVAIS